MVHWKSNLGDGVGVMYASNSFGELLRLALSKIAILSPFFPLVVVGAFIKRNTRLNLYGGVILVCGLSLVLSQALLYSLGKTVGELRYFINIIPLTLLLFLIYSKQVENSISKIVTKVSYLLMIAALIGSSVSSAYAMYSKQFNNQEHIFVQALLSGRNTSVYYNYDREEVIAEYITNNLQNEKILIDDLVGFPILYAAKQPRLFVQSTDTNFKTALKDPQNTGISYMLVSEPTISGSGDLINQTYPQLYESGTEFAQLEQDFGNWRLYKIGDFTLTDS